MWQSELTHQVPHPSSEPTIKDEFIWINYLLPFINCPQLLIEWSVYGEGFRNKAGRNGEGRWLVGWLCSHPSLRRCHVQIQGLFYLSFYWPFLLIFQFLNLSSFLFRKCIARTKTTSLWSRSKRMLFISRTMRL